MHLSIISIIISASIVLYPGAKAVPDTFVTIPTKSKPVSAVQPLQAVEQVELVLYTPPHPIADDAAGNEYPIGQCTALVKSRRPDIPNHLGDARFWFDELKALGWSVGYTPRAGAIGASILGNHVVYVMSVNADSSIHLEEANFDYNGSYRQRDADASLFRYIY